MRNMVLAILAFGTVAASEPARAQTYAPNYPVCLHVYGPVTYYECGYTSLAQCGLSASGRGAMRGQPLYGQRFGRTVAALLQAASPGVLSVYS